MALPDFTMRELLEAGVHFGHQSHRWNPKMKQFIYGARSGIHIMDLSQTVPLLYRALLQVRETAAKGGRILFVGTKRQAAGPVAEAALRCAQYYMNHRWLGGTLTNWTAVSNSIKRLRELEETLSEKEQSGLTKKELLNVERDREKLDKALGGIANMGGLPDIIIVIDTNREAIAIKEARKLGIPVVAVVDTNCDPDDVDFPFPGNDDAARAISLYCNLFADAVLDGLAESSAGLGIDLGETEYIAALVEQDIAAADAAAENLPAGHWGEQVSLVPRDSPLNVASHGADEALRTLSSTAYLEQKGLTLHGVRTIKKFRFLSVSLRNSSARFEIVVDLDSQSYSKKHTFRWELKGSLIELFRSTVASLSDAIDRDDMQIEVYNDKEMITFGNISDTIKRKRSEVILSRCLGSDYPQGLRAISTSEGLPSIDLFASQQDSGSAILIYARSEVDSLIVCAKRIDELVGASLAAGVPLEPDTDSIFA